MKICMNATTVTQKENYFSVATNCTEIRIFFLTDHIIRIRAGFDGDFAEESYSLVTTAWEDRMGKTATRILDTLLPSFFFPCVLLPGTATINSIKTGQTVLKASILFLSFVMFPPQGHEVSVCLQRFL